MVNNTEDASVTYKDKNVAKFYSFPSEQPLRQRAVQILMTKNYIVFVSGLTNSG